jgi:hypothetical protein
MADQKPMSVGEHREHTERPSREAISHLPEDVRAFNASEDDRLGHFDYPDEGHLGHAEGLELQAGLEEAVRREGSRDA